jgi:hypothetical protein
MYSFITHGFFFLFFDKIQKDLSCVELTRKNDYGLLLLSDIIYFPMDVLIHQCTGEWAYLFLKKRFVDSQ